MAKKSRQSGESKLLIFTGEYFKMISQPLRQFRITLLKGNQQYRKKVKLEISKGGNVAPCLHLYTNDNKHTKYE